MPVSYFWQVCEEKYAPWGLHPIEIVVPDGLKFVMSDPRNVAHDKKIIHQKQNQGENLATGAAHMPQPGKKTARKAAHGAHTETEVEEAGGTGPGSKA